MPNRGGNPSPLRKGNTRGFEVTRNVMLSYNKGLKEPSRQLRKNMTETERLFWSRVRGKQLSGAQFYRQKIIGDYIVDFYCPQAKLVVEIDGAQHYEGWGVENMVGVLETVRGQIPLNPPLSKGD